MEIKERIPRCPHGKSEDVKQDLINALSRLEKEVGKELKYTSGYRCEECNRKCGGVEHSAHLRGLGVDISCMSGVERMLVVSIAARIGFRRIGVGKTIVHLDVDQQNPQDVLWVY